MSAEEATLNKQSLDPDAAWEGVFGDPRWLFKTSVGGMAYAASLLLLMLNLLTLPVVVLLVSYAQGYLLKVARSQCNDAQSKLPEWSGHFDLLMSGLTWLAVQSIIYLSVASVVATIVLASSLLQGLRLPSGVMVASGAGAFLAVVLIVVSSEFVKSFLMINLSVEESTTAGFDVFKVLRLVSRNLPECLASWLLGVGFVAIGFLLPLMTVFGAVVLPSVVFVSQLLATKVKSQVWDGMIK